MKPITKSQIITISTLINQKGLSEDRQRIATEASGGRSCHISDLYFDEAKTLINFLTTRTEQPNNKMIRKIFAIAHEMQWIRKEQVIGKGGVMKEKNNYDSLNKFIEERGVFKKPLREYTEAELPRLVSQIEKVYTYYLKK